MDADFEAAVNKVMGPDEEGAYSNDPTDPGGETKFGVSKRAHPEIDIKNLTRDGAKDLFYKEYWTPASHYFPANASMQMKRCIFESFINQGQPRTLRWLEEAKGQLSWFQAERAMAYIADRNFARDGRGWLRRLFLEMVV